jgi:hypothetical protein
MGKWRRRGRGKGWERRKMREGEEWGPMIVVFPGPGACIDGPACIHCFGATGLTAEWRESQLDKMLYCTI